MPQPSGLFSASLLLPVAPLLTSEYANLTSNMRCCITNTKKAWTSFQVTALKVSKGMGQAPTRLWTGLLAIEPLFKPLADRSSHGIHFSVENSMLLAWRLAWKGKWENPGATPHLQRKSKDGGRERKRKGGGSQTARNGVLCNVADCLCDCIWLDLRLHSAPVPVRRASERVKERGGLWDLDWQVIGSSISQINWTNVFKWLQMIYFNLFVEDCKSQTWNHHQNFCLACDRLRLVSIPVTSGNCSLYWTFIQPLCGAEIHTDSFCLSDTFHKDHFETSYSSKKQFTYAIQCSHWSKIASQFSW